MNKTIKLVACSKNEKLYKTTTGKIYSRHKLISLIKNNKAIVTTSSGAEVSLFSFEGKEFLRSDHNNKESDNLSETLLPFSVLKHHSWLLAGLLCLGIIASNVVYPLIILDERKTHKTELSSFIAEIDLGEIESDTGPAIQSRAVELNSKASDLDWSQLTFTQITSTGAHIDAKNDSKSYSGHVNVTFSIPSIIEYNVEGTNWPGYISGYLNYSLSESNFTYTITSNNGSSHPYYANNLVIPNTIIDGGISYNVTQLDMLAFAGYADRLTGTITLPETLTSIGMWAFVGCASLSGSLVIPNSVTSIGIMAFQNCVGFNGILTLPSNSSYTTIDTETFSNCNFSTVVFPNTITMITSTAFNFNFNLSTIICNYASNPTGFAAASFDSISSTGTVQNTNPAYSSEQLLAFLKASCSLPSNWTAIS